MTTPFAPPLTAPDQLLPQLRDQGFAVLGAASVAALAGNGAPTLVAPSAGWTPTRWWSRPIGELLRPPAVPVLERTRGRSD